MVEHDEEAILSADHVVDIGPVRASMVVKVVAFGTPYANYSASITGQYLTQKSIPIPRRAGKSIIVA